MWKNLWFAPYELKLKTVPKKRLGALLKIEFADGKTGHADLHPYPEKGEASLTSHLEVLRQIPLVKGVKKVFGGYSSVPQLSRNSLKDQHSKNLCLRAIATAREESLALAKGINLLSSLKIPLSHFLIWDLNASSPALIESALLKGFRVFKVKLSHPLKEQSEKLLQLIKAFDFNNVHCSPLPARLRQLSPVSEKIHRPLAVKWRLDFRVSLSKRQWEEWKTQYLFRIPFSSLDFVEAPPVAFPIPTGDKSCVKPRLRSKPYNKNLKLAFDVWNGENKLPVPVLVCKPARKSLTDLFKQKAQNLFQKVVFTHCLSHPLDQLSSAYFCAKFYKVHPRLSEICGLTQNNIYEPFAFTLPNDGPAFPQLSGPGFGLNPRHLDNLSWKKLT